MSIEDQLARYGEHLDTLPLPPVTARRPPRVLAVAAIALVVVAGVVVAVLRQEEPPSALGAGGPPVALVPRSVPEGGARRAPMLDAGHAVFGAVRTAAAGDLITVAIVEPGSSVMTADRIVDAEVHGQRARYDPASPSGGSTLVWAEGGRGLIVRAGSGVDQAAVLHFAEDLRVAADGTFDAGWLPPGWSELWDGSAAGPFDEYVTFVSDPDDASHSVQVTSWDRPPAGAQFAIESMTDATAVTVRAVDGFLQLGDEDNPFLWWVEPSGIVVLVQQSGGDAASIRAVAESLVPVDAAGWAQLVADRS